MPTPPPWWIETQVAPPAVLSSALSSGQSAIGVGAVLHRLGLAVGEATEPQSRWSRPMTIGAFSSPSAHHLVEGEAGLGALAVAEPADARRQALEGDALARPCRASGAAARCRGTAPSRTRVGGVDVLGVAGERAQRNGPIALAEQRPDVGGHEAGEVEGVRTPASKPPGGCCCRSRRPRRRPSLEAEHRLDVRGHRGARRGVVPAAGSRSRALGGLLVEASPRAGSR
jgi:hypothetical protein